MRHILKFLTIFNYKEFDHGHSQGHEQGDKHCFFCDQRTACVYEKKKSKNQKHALPPSLYLGHSCCFVKSFSMSFQGHQQPFGRVDASFLGIGSTVGLLIIFLMFTLCTLLGHIIPNLLEVLDNFSIAFYLYTTILSTSNL